MARNFAQIAFLIYGVVLLFLTRTRILKLAERRVPRSVLSQYRRSGGANSFLFLTLKAYMAPGIYYFNLVNFSFVAILSALHLVIGWFSFAAMFLKAVNSLMLLSVGAEAWLVCLGDNARRFGTPFFLYRADEDPATNRAFASSILDAILYVILPILMAVCNFTTL